MATKTNLISAINGFLTAIITQTKVRSAALETVNELYPTLITETNLTTNVFTINSTPVAYVFKISKQGNRVNMSGFIHNTTGSILGEFIVANITNAEYNSAGTFYDTNEDGSRLFVNDLNELKMQGLLGNGSKFFFNITYTTID